MLCSNREKDGNKPDFEHEFKEQGEKASELLEANQNPVNGPETESPAERSVKLSEVTSEMANIGRRLQSQLTSIHETVCKENETAKEGSKNWDPFSPELIARLHDSTSDVNCEVKVLERYLDQVRELITLGGVKSNCINGLLYEENNNQPDDQKLSLKGQVQNDDDRKKWTKEMEFLKNQLDHEGLIRRLESDRSKLETENLNFKRQLKLIKDKLRERGQMDEELDSLTNVECRPGEEDEDGFALSELVTLRKERKVLLATVHRLQSQATGGSKKSDSDSKSDVGTSDVAVQCKLNILGQIENQDVTLSNELEELKKKIHELQTEYEELEEENKSMEDENSKLTEEKRALEDSVNKLRSQITDALDSSLDEMEHLHREKEDYQNKFQLLEEANKKLRDSFAELSKKNADHLESVLDEIERKDSLEDAVDYLGTEVQKLNEINSCAVSSSTTEACLPGDIDDKIHKSSLLSEIKTCKELIDSQRAQIRQLQIDKRDIEDRYTNLKRELVNQKTKRGEKRSLECKSSEKDGGSDSMQPTRKSSVERCEFLKQDILRLTKRGTELENVIRALKSDNSNLEEEKVCLLDSLYHQLEKNEKLEVQIDKLKSIINEHNIAKGLDPTTKLLPNGKQRDDASDRERDLNGNVVDGNNGTRCQLEKNEDGSSVDELRTKSLQLSEELKTLQERVLEIEKENERIQQDLNESRKSEKELRDVVSELKKEDTVNRHQLQKNQEVTDTLQGCLREAHEEKEELVESLDEVTEEKKSLEKKVETLENELNELKENYQRAMSELQTAAGGVDNVDKTKQEIKSIHAKLSELYESLTDKDKESSCEELDTELQQSTSLGEQGNDILSLIEKVQQEVTLLIKEIRRVKADQEDLKAKVEASQTEKLSLQRYVRELDEKRRQMKSFITKLTEEKEAMSEQMDDIKQQKNNLADALENVYQSKEGLQSQLEDALSTQHERSKSLSEVSAEVQSLKKSLGRMVEERDALKEALLETTNELQELKKSEAKWKEKVTGAQVEADQSVGDTSEEDKEDGKDAIIRLHLENDGLRKQLEELKSSQRSSLDELPEEAEAPISSIDDTEIKEPEKTSEGEIEAAMAAQYGSNLPVYEMVTTFDNSAFEEPFTDETDLIVPSEGSSTLESALSGDQQEEVDERFNKVCAEKKALEVELKQIADEMEQVKSWFNSISAEKEVLEKEYELMAKENGEMLRDLERSREEEAKLKLRLEEISKQEDNDKSLLEDKTRENTQLQEDLQKQVEENKEMAEALQLSNMRKDTLESEIKESREKAETLETYYQTLQATNDELAKNNSTLQEEKEDLNKSSEKLAEEYKNLEKKYTELNAEKERTVWESDTRTKEVARLLEQVEVLGEQLQEKSHTLTDLEHKLKDAEKGKQDFNALVAEMKSEKEALQSKHDQLSNDYKALEERLAKAETEIGAEGENIEKLKQEFENTAKTLNDDVENLKVSLKDVQGKLDQTADDLKVAEAEKETLSAQVAELNENEKLLRKEIDGKSQENLNLQESVETLQGDKEFLARKLEETKIKSNSMRDQLQDLRNQASDLRSFVDEKLNSNSDKQSEEIPREESNLLQSVCEYIEALSEEKASLEARLEKAETSNREIRDDNKQLLEERTELTIQLHEALDKETTEDSPSRQGYDEVRLSREISDVRSLIEKLSFQKEKLGAALAHKESQIAAVTAEALEKAKMLENKEKEAESLSMTKAEVAVALEAAKNGSEKLLEDLQREKSKVASLTQELEDLKKLENVDLQVCVNRLEEEKKAFMMAVNKSRELEKRLKKAEEENIKIQEQKNELEANVEAQAASIVSFETIGLENEVKWMTELKEKDEELYSLKGEMKKSNIALTDLLRVVDELKSKIAELEKQCNEAAKSRKEAVEEINNLQKKLKEETERKKALETKLEEMELTIAKHEEENKDLKKQLMGNDSEKQSLQKSLKELEGKNKDKARQLLDLNCTKTFLEDECKKSNSEITSLKEQLAKKTLSLESIEKGLNDSKDFIHEGKTKYAELRNEKEELQKSLDAAESKLRKAEAANTKTKEQNEKLTKKLEAIEKEMTSLNSAFGEAQNKEQTLLVEIKTETERLESELESLKAECETLQEKLDEANEKKDELAKELEQRTPLEKDLAKLTDEHKALKIFSQKLVDDKVDLEEARKEKRELEKQLRREKNERVTIEEKMARLQSECEALKLARRKVVAEDQMDAGDIPQSEGEQIIASTEGGLLSTGVEIEFGLESAPDEEGCDEDMLAKERELSALLREEIEDLTDEKDELNEVIDKLRSKTKKLQRSVDVLIDEKESLEDKLDENTKRHKEEVGSLEDGNKELSRKLEVLLEDKTLLREEIKTKDKEYSVVLEEGKKLEDALEKSKQELKRLTKGVDSEVKKRSEGELTKSKEKVKELENKLEKMSLEKQQLMSELAERKNENSALRLAAEEMTVAKEDAESKSGMAQKALYDELDHMQQKLDKKNTEIEDQIAKYKQPRPEQGRHEEETPHDLKELEELRRKLHEKDQTIESLENEFAAHKQLSYEREQEIHIHLDRIQEKLKEKDKNIASLKDEIAEYKRTGKLEKQDSDETPGEIPDKEYHNKLAKLQTEIAEKEKRIGSLEEAIIDYRRTRFEQERDFHAKESHLAAAREELFKTMKERYEEEQRMENVRHANNRLQEALDLAREKESKLKKELQTLQGKERSQSIVIEERVRSASTGNVLECSEIKVKIKPSEVAELSLAPPETEPRQLEKRVTSSSLENARKEIATLEAHEQQLRSELRKARDQVFDLQLELSDALRALKQKERLHEQERRRFQSSIEDMENEYNKLRKEFSSIISMEKNRSSFITVVELKGSLKKAEADMLGAIAKISELLNKAKNDIKESRRVELNKEIAERSSERTKSFIEKCTQENKDLLKQLDDAWKERDRLAKRLKRSEGAQALLKHILNESLVEVERFKRLVDFCGKPDKRRTASVGSQKPAATTRELETQSDLTSTDLEEAELLKDHLEELRRNIRGLETCLDEERSKGEGHLLDYLREKNRLNAEITALKQCMQESSRKNEVLQSMVSDLEEQLQLAQKKKTAVEIEFTDVRNEVDKLRNLSYDERAEKNSLIQANAELVRSLLETNENHGKVVKSEKAKDLKKEKERLTAENETLKKTARDNKDNFATVCKELENAKYRISELSNAKESVIKKSMSIESELRAKKENLTILEKYHDELKTKYRSLEENCKELDNERIQLIEDAHSFKVKMEKKNQDLLSKLEAKEHEAISLQAKVEGLSALQRKLENDCRGLEKEREVALSQVRSLESGKQRIEAFNREQKSEIERLMLDKGSRKDLNDKIKSLFAEKDKLEEMNKSLKMDVRELYKKLDAKGEEVNNLVQELHDMASKVDIAHFC